MNVPRKIKLWYWWFTHKGTFISIAGFSGFLLIILLLLYLMEAEPTGEKITKYGVVDKAYYQQSESGSRLRHWQLILENGKNITIRHKRWWDIKNGDCVHIIYKQAKWTKRIIVQSLKESQKCK